MGRLALAYGTKKPAEKRVNFLHVNINSFEMVLASHGSVGADPCHQEKTSLGSAVTKTHYKH